MQGDDTGSSHGTNTLRGGDGQDILTGGTGYDYIDGGQQPASAQDHGCAEADGAQRLDAEDPHGSNTLPPGTGPC